MSAAVLALASAKAEGLLRVCADPNNLPFSNQARGGFENRVADLLARDLGRKVEFTWWAMRRGVVRNALNEHQCDVLMAMPVDSDMVLTTEPYYRSAYVFASRKDRALHVRSLNDPRFSTWKIGVHLVGNDLAPPAHALAARGVVGNFVPFSMFGPYGEQNPPSKLVQAIANGDVDVGIVWGPFAGYFAKSAKVPLDVVPVSPQTWQSMPFAFSISAAVRKGDTELKSELDRALQHQCAAIQTVLSDYGVPQVEEGRPRCEKPH